MNTQKLFQVLKIFKENYQELLSSIPDEAVIFDRAEDWRRGLNDTLQNVKLARIKSLLFPNKKQPIRNLVFSLKNSIYIESRLASGGSDALLNHYPPFSSTIYKRLTEAGAIHACTSALDEFGMGSAGVYCNVGILGNPYDSDRVCGGSSSGAAYLVSKGVVDFAIGTDTGGSIRTPASYTSVYGFKPSYGLVSREGILPLCTLLDTPSIMSNSIDVIFNVLNTIQGPDPLDLTTLKSSNKPLKKFPKTPLLAYKSEDKPKKLNFVVFEELLKYPKDRNLSQQEAEIKKNYSNLINRLREDPRCNLFSAKLDWVPLELAELTYRVIAYSEAITHYFSLNGIVTPWNGLIRGALNGYEVEADYREKAKEIRQKMGKEVQLRHLMGYFFLYSTNYRNIYLQARRLMNLYMQKMQEILSEGKILISPTTPTIAPLLSNFSNDYQTDKFSSVLLLSNFAGSPAISIPWLEFSVKVKLKKSVVFVGLHLTCKRWEDQYLLSTVQYLEKNNLL